MRICTAPKRGLAADNDDDDDEDDEFLTVKKHDVFDSRGAGGEAADEEAEVPTSAAGFEGRGGGPPKKKKIKIKSGKVKPGGGDGMGSHGLAWGSGVNYLLLSARFSTTNSVHIGALASMLGSSRPHSFVHSHLHAQATGKRTVFNDDGGSLDPLALLASAEWSAGGRDGVDDRCVCVCERTQLYV